ncbi:MAG: hybrid sensor histidine kinase/response regulator [Elusimicrobia bacterium]|nr:MAG: hybrid sensor histidine kinase/response regulator [Elusimicrobiota bacterium]
MNGFQLSYVQELLSHVISEAPVVLFALDKEGVFLISEGKGLASLGLKPGDLVGTSALEYYSDNTELVHGIKRALKGETFKKTDRTKQTYWETSYQPIKKEDGSCGGTIGVSIDITERMEAVRADREHLRRERSLRIDAENASRSKDEFLALLSHELRTPMTAMLGWTFLLRSGDMNSDEFKSALDAIERNMKAQAQIIEDLLDVSRIVTGKVRLETRPIEVDSIVQAAVDVVRPAAKARKIELRIELRDPTAVVLGDPERLQQAIWNLVSNAVKFSEEGQTVSVCISKNEEEVTISVCDEGGGIHEDYLPHLFDPFTQAESSLTREHGGLGLGLAIVRHIIDLHGGKITAKSGGVGKGSVFEVVVPIAESGSVAVPPEKGRQDRKTLFGKVPDLTGTRVLVVDDDAGTRTMLKAVLEYAKVDVTLASSAAEGFELVQSGNFHVLLIDIMMPGEDGHSLVRRIRELSPEKGGDVPATAVTARVGIEDRTEALKAGFQMYLPKPVEPAELVVVVQALAAEKTKRS